MKKLYIVSESKTGSDCGSDHELIAKFRLKLRKFIAQKQENEALWVEVIFQDHKMNSNLLLKL